MFKLFSLVIMTRQERTDEVLQNFDEKIKSDWDILNLSMENETLRARLERAEKKNNNSEIKFGEF